MSQLIAVLASPLLTRIYAPESFGTLSVFSSLLAMLSIVATMEFDRAIPLPETDEEALDVVILAVVALLSISLIVLAGQYLGEGFLSNWFSLSILREHAWLLPVSLLLTGTYQIVSHWAVRERAFKSIAATRVSQSLVSVCVQVVLYPLQSFGLVFGYSLSRFVGVYGLGKRLKTSFGGHTLRWSRLSSVASRHRQFPLFAMPNELLNSAGRHFPAILLAFFFGPATAGFYSLAERVVAMPVLLVGNATAEVFLSTAPEAHRKGYLSAFVMALQKQLVRVYGLPYVLVLLVAPEIFALAFGLDWRVAGEITQLLVPWLLVRSLSNPLASVARVTGKLGTGLVFEVILVTLRIGGLLVGCVYGSSMVAIGLFSAGATVGIVAKLLWLYALSGVSLGHLLRILAPEFGVLTSVGIAGFLLKLHSSPMFFWSYCIALAGYACYSSVAELRSGVSHADSTQTVQHAT